MDEQIIDNMRVCSADMDKWGKKFAELEPTLNQLKETKKNLLASLMLNYTGPQWKVEAEARQSEDWQKFLNSLEEVEKQALEAKVLWENRKAQFFGLQTRLSVEKAKMQIT